jgi:DNA-binding XRE family transcriptional regulator
MKEDVSGRREYRAMTPSEISGFVKIYRRTWGIKQAALAEEAHVSEKTVERLENGNKMSIDVYRNIALAIGQKEDAFTASRFIRTAENAAHEAAEFLKDWNAKYVAVDIEPLTDESAFERIFTCLVWALDKSHLTGSALGLAAEFQRDLQDWLDAKSVMTEPELLSAYKSLLGSTSAIARLGYIARYGFQTYPVPAFGKGQTVRVALILFFPRSDWKRSALKTIVTPRSFVSAVMCMI